MMKVLRKNLLKHIFGIALLSIMLVKLCAPSISKLSCSAFACAMEKNTEEGKDTKEEALEKSEKKFYVCVFNYLDHGHFLWTNYPPASIYSYKMQIGSHPVRTVPTPPPDQLG